jgi:uncharacterized membrane protein
VPDIPENMVSSQLPTALLSLWPKYLGYFLSFVGISVFWMIHHSIFRPISAYDRTLLYLRKTLVGLGFFIITMLPSESYGATQR